MMTRKDFERIAQVFRVNRPTTEHHNYKELPSWRLWDALLDDMCVELQAINPRFDVDRFKEACNATK